MAVFYWQALNCQVNPNAIARVNLNPQRLTLKTLKVSQHSMLISMRIMSSSTCLEREGLGDMHPDAAARLPPENCPEAPEQRAEVNL